METTYNISNKTSLAEPVRIVRFVPDAQRNQNFAPLCGNPQPDPLWRYLFYSSVLQETETQIAFAEKGSFSSTFRSLSSRRINPGYHLCSDCWCPPFKQNKGSSGQWCFSTDCRLEELPIFQQSKTFLKKNSPRRYSEHQQSSRFL